MKLFFNKIFLYYSVSFIIYKIIKSKFKKKYISENNVDYNNNIYNKTQINYQKNNQNKVKDYYMNKENIENRENKQIINESIITLIHNKNIELNNDNNLNYDISVKANYLYKIICNIECENIDNIKLIIKENDENNEFSYSSIENTTEKISKFSFILDNNIFSENDDKIINISLFFSNTKNNLNDNEIINININNFSLKVIEKDIVKKNNSIIIFDINGMKYPIFTDVSNIIEYKVSTDNNLLFNHNS